MAAKRSSSTYSPFGGLRIAEGLYMGDFYAAEVR
jgi:hypothetical protein